jgi:hypothetical protein
MLLAIYVRPRFLQLRGFSMKRGARRRSEEKAETKLVPLININYEANFSFLCLSAR